MQETLIFLETIVDKNSKEMIAAIHTEVSQGELFSIALKKAGFSDVVCSQLYFSLYHGHLGETAIKSGEQLLKQAEKKKKMKAVLNYPAILFLFVVMMLLAMRFILLPHINDLVSVGSEQLDLGTRMIVAGVYHAPVILAAGSLICLIGFLLVYVKCRKMSPLERLNWIAKRSRSSLYRLYWSQFFSNEWGFLLKGNSGLLEVVTIMKQNTLSPLITEIGAHIEQKMKQGDSFHDSLKEFVFLKEEIMLVVRQGERSGHLGHELEMYALTCEEEFDKKIEQRINLIQPIIFIFVSLIIVAIYAALLLPTFNALNTF
ncbi:competence protein CglB [Alkalibacterium kapii]|uniref:Competence protein CglB n=1 Tax=Alkalibacterium kapii TaxID=426704 RepID=A0A511AT30_9LACT|nr:competence protein CglB [Alkalibacterium kapii]